MKRQDPDDERARAMRATHCRSCSALLPSDRIAVAREERATDTARGYALAARLESDRCLTCSEPGRSAGNDGSAFRTLGQRVGNGRVSS